MFADHIIYADESGSPVLDGVDPDYPVFVLAFVLVEKAAYQTQVVPGIQKLKFDFLGHDQVILHERDIRRQKDAFAFLQADPDARFRFLQSINDLVADAPMEVVAAAIDKIGLRKRDASPWSPYDIALQLCLEQALEVLLARQEAGKLVHVVFESRGAREDTELELRFRQITSNEGQWGHHRLDFSVMRWKPIFADKRSNSSGLQLADLVARPIGLKALRPQQANRAYEVVQTKLSNGSFLSFP